MGTATLFQEILDFYFCFGFEPLVFPSVKRLLKDFHICNVNALISLGKGTLCNFHFILFFF